MVGWPGSGAAEAGGERCKACDRIRPCPRLRSGRATPLACAHASAVRGQAGAAAQHTSPAAAGLQTGTDLAQAETREEQQPCQAAVQGRRWPCTHCSTWPAAGNHRHRHYAGCSQWRPAASARQQSPDRSKPVTGNDIRQTKACDRQRSWAACEASSQHLKSGSDLVQSEAEGGQQPSQADDGHPQVAQAVLHQQVAALQRGLEGDGFAACAACCSPASLDKGEPAGEVGGFHLTSPGFENAGALSPVVEQRADRRLCQASAPAGVNSGQQSACRRQHAIDSPEPRQLQQGGLPQAQQHLAGNSAVMPDHQASLLTRGCCWTRS